MASNSPFSKLPVRRDLFTGLDVGGTKVHIADTLSSTINRYETVDYKNMDEILDDYFQTVSARPSGIVIGMAGPCDDETGEIRLSNSNWPTFKPQEAALKYGIAFRTVNDMVATTAGVLQKTGVDLLSLKPGTPTRTGTKMVVTISTGIGSAAAIWDTHSNRYVIVDGEGGQIGFQPKTEEEGRYLSYLHKKYPHPSAELALSGKQGIDNLIDHTLAARRPTDLARAINKARIENRPVGAVLLEIATQGDGIDKVLARGILQTMGAMIGSVLHDLAVTYKASGGVYLTGSVALALSEYLANNTEMLDRFVYKGSVLEDLLERIPINLMMDPNIAASGALALAKGL